MDDLEGLDDLDEMDDLEGLDDLDDMKDMEGAMAVIRKLRDRRAQFDPLAAIYT